MLNAFPVKASKQPAANTEFDREKFLKYFRNDDAYLKKLQSYIEKMLQNIRNKNIYSLSRDIPPRYRKNIIKSFITIHGENVLHASGIVTVDDVISTGTTVPALASLLREAGYTDDIIVLSLVNNR